MIYDNFLKLVWGILFVTVFPASIYFKINTNLFIVLTFLSAFGPLTLNKILHRDKSASKE